MTTKKRLERLEKQAAVRPNLPPGSLLDRIDAWDAYYAGEGPRPPDGPTLEESWPADAVMSLDQLHKAMENAVAREEGGCP